MEDDTHVIENQTEEPEVNENKKANPLLLGGVVLAILLLFVGVALSQRNKNTTDNQAVLSENEEVTVTEDTEFNEEVAPEDAMVIDESQEEVMEEVPGEIGEESDARIVEVEGGSFYFKPNTITVNKGETVKIVFNNVDGMHDFVVDELDIKTPVIKANETSEVEFTAEEAGEYEFYCSVGSHRQMGMKGTLIVK